MTETPRRSLRTGHAGALSTESHRIEGAVDDIFGGAEEASRTTADQAYRSAHDPWGRGRDNLTMAERPSRAGSWAVAYPFKVPPLATALAAGAMGYVFGMLVHRPSR